MRHLATLCEVGECDELEAMLIYSMSVSVNGFIADREGAFGWTAPNESWGAYAPTLPGLARLWRSRGDLR